MFIAGIVLVFLGLALFVPGLNIKPKSINPEDSGLIIAGLIGAIVMGYLAWGTKWLVTAISFGVLVGILVVKGFNRVRGMAFEQSKKREVILLFEACDLFLQAKMSLMYALMSARMITPNISGAINKCLGMWSTGSTRALEVLRKEINMPEADILTGLLVQIDRVGVERLEGIIQREGQSLERLYEATARAKITTRPLYFVVYRILPLIAVFGMFAGVLFWRVINVLKQAGL